jgi:hypothetical protein
MRKKEDAMSSQVYKMMEGRTEGKELGSTRPEGEFLAYQIGPDLEARKIPYRFLRFC